MSTDTSNPKDQSKQDPPKAEADGSIEETQLTVPFPDSFVYSNVSALSASFMDIRISFAEAMPNGQAQAKVGIVMPAEHAAPLVLNLLQNLITFERNFGQIRHPQWREFRENAKAAVESMLKARNDPSPTGKS